jgi:putative oxidoreductase
MVVLEGGIMQKAARIALWICQAALALMFLLAGAGKFTSPMWVRMFARWGYPDHFHLVVGAVEVAAGLALLVPRLAAPASIALIVVMIGAGATHAIHGELDRLAQIVVMSLMLGAIAYGRRADAFWRKAARAPA